MAEATYSADQTPLAEETLSGEIRAAVRELREAYPQGSVTALSWNEHYVAISLHVEVNLPSRGALHDIRPNEPLLLLVDKIAYPFKCPFVRSDRKDFPRRELPHLNPVGVNEPASLCLHRGKIDDWFAEHTIVGLVERAREWLSDASADLLVRPEDDFEPTRIESVGFYTLFDPSSVISQIEGVRNNDAGHGFAIHEWILDAKADPHLRADVLATRLVSIRTATDAETIKSDFQSVTRACGLVAWPARGTIVNEWFSTLPGTVGELIRFASDLGIDLTRALTDRFKAELEFKIATPVTLAIPRGRNLIGTDVNIELLTFAILTTKETAPTSLPWNEQLTVFTLQHRKPVTVELAREISSLPRESDAKSVLLLGAGALGSKLSLHLARRGHVDQTIIDFDTMEPHNLVRHALSGRHVGEPKATALRDELNSLFPAAGAKAQAEKINAIDYFAKTPREDSKFDLILDATATPTMINAILHAPVGAARVARTEMTYGGRLGITMMEGPHRLPRLDDLQARIFDMAVEHDELSAWLQENHRDRDERVGSRHEDINLGISCSSDTLRLADDVVSHHAAQTSMVLRAAAAQGGIQFSWLDPSGADATKFKLERYSSGAPFVRRALNDETWQVRMAAGIDAAMQEKLKEAAPREAGGLVMGFAHKKRRVVYITRLLDAPVDSKGTRYGFYRGTRDLPQRVEHVGRRTAGLISYMGEWHTHPKGGARLSSTDLSTKEKLYRENKPAGVPTHLIVVTPTEIAPYVFP